MAAVPDCLYYQSPDQQAAAEACARSLGLAAVLVIEHGAPAQPGLLLDDQGLSWLPGEGMGPVRVDFSHGPLAWRARQGGGRGQTLARACGLKPGINPSIIDACAGLGRDAFVLASLGARVRMLERSAMIAALLRDGLARAQSDEALAPWLDGRLDLYQGDARILLPELCAVQRPEVIYLDPMYPKREKSALVKKEMRLFRSLLGEDADAPELLQQALALTGRRVVVKRPKGAEPLQGPKPSLALASKNTRYDIYLTVKSGR
jgi:16S rRNA (guanine1516-N2)-methyltransferase